MLTLRPLIFSTQQPCEAVEPREGPAQLTREAGLRDRERGAAEAPPESGRRSASPTSTLPGRAAPLLPPRPSCAAPSPASHLLLLRPPPACSSGRPPSPAPYLRRRGRSVPRRWTRRVRRPGAPATRGGVESRAGGRGGGQDSAWTKLGGAPRALRGVGEGGSAEPPPQPGRKRRSRKAEAGGGGRPAPERRPRSGSPARSGISSQAGNFCGGASASPRLWGPRWRGGLGPRESPCRAPDSSQWGFLKSPRQMSRSLRDQRRSAELPSRRVPDPLDGWRPFDVCFGEPLARCVRRAPGSQ